MKFVDQHCWRHWLIDSFCLPSNALNIFFWARNYINAIRYRFWFDCITVDVTVESMLCLALALLCEHFILNGSKWNRYTNSCLLLLLMMMTMTMLKIIVINTTATTISKYLYGMLSGYAVCFIYALQLDSIRFVSSNSDFFHLNNLQETNNINNNFMKMLQFDSNAIGWILSLLFASHSRVVFLFY